MFQNYYYDYLGYSDNGFGFFYKYKVTIVDSGFEEAVDISVNAKDVEIETIVGDRASCHALISIYSKRNLNVPHNLFLFMKKVEEKSYLWGINLQLENYRKNIKEFLTYEDEIIKYIARYNNQKMFW